MLVELLPRVGSPRPPVGVLGPGFTLCVVNAGNGLRVFLESTVSSETLSRFYGVKKSSYEELLRVLGDEVWVGEARLKREFDFYHTDIIVADIPGLVNSLENKGGVCISVSRDPGLKMVFASKASSLLSKASKYHNSLLDYRARSYRRGWGGSS
ncbi:MAG: hypothetical protein LM590_11890 [Thermofilum sp.]|nr:hypothetical protein [Thermofilum sp.]